MLINRMIRAAMLDPRLYEEVEHDRSASGQAVRVVIIIALISGLGGAIGMLTESGLLAAAFALIREIVTQVIAWLIWALITYFIGTKAYGGTATYGEMLRTLGFAQSAKVLFIFAWLFSSVFLLGGMIWFAVNVWVLLAVIIAIRQALDVKIGVATLTALIGWVVVLTPQVLAGWLGIGYPF